MLSCLQEELWNEAIEEMCNWISKYVSGLFSTDNNSNTNNKYSNSGSGSYSSGSSNNNSNMFIVVLKNLLEISSFF